MRIEELKGSLSENLFPIYLVEGEDAYFRELAIKTLQNKFLSNPDLNLNTFEGSEVKADPSAMIEALLQYPFMSEKRVIIVREYLPSATDLKNKQLAEYLQNPVDTSVLIIVNVGKSEVLKKQKNVCVVDCGKSTLELLIRYIQGTLKRNNLIINAKTAQILCEYCQMDMTRISGEVQKLSAYCHGLMEVTQEDIEQMVTKDTDFQIFEMTENVAQKRYDKAYEILNDMLSKSSDYQKLFVSLYYHFRKLFNYTISLGSPAIIAKQYGVHEYGVKKAIEQGKRFGLKKLKQILDMFEGYDRDFKSGKISAQSVLTLCVGKIME